MMTDEEFMAQAVAEARRAAQAGEVPVGAVVVKDGAIIARGRNRREELADPTAHAEVLAIREAGAKSGGWRLSGCVMYVTVEPCPMCAGALVQARVDRLVFGTRDPKAGACGSTTDIVRDPRYNHRLHVTEGVLEEECRQVIQEFFRIRRDG
jgi:tRNA(adenine34) deaminase